MTLASNLPKYTIASTTISAAKITEVAPVEIVGDSTGPHFAIKMAGANNQKLETLVPVSLVRSAAVPHLPVPGDYHKIDASGVVSLVPKATFESTHTLL